MKNAIKRSKKQKSEELYQEIQKFIQGCYRIVVKKFGLNINVVLDKEEEKRFLEEFPPCKNVKHDKIKGENDRGPGLNSLTPKAMWWRSNYIY